MNPVLINATISRALSAFSWMLIHSLWEGLVFAIITGAILMFAKKSNAARRYNLVLVVFAVFIAACGLTFIYELNGAASGSLSSKLPVVGGGSASNWLSGCIYIAMQLIKSFSDYFSANQPVVLLVWFIFFLFKSVKMLSCMVYNQQIRTRHIYESPAFWAEKADAFSKSLQITKAVKLFQSGYIKMPVVLGHLKPVIIIPIGLMANLPVDQVEAILLHELAHIRRNDYFVNFLQNIAETIFFFNPGLLWISALLREERENCCDDIALEQTQNKVGFVKALISFKEHELYGADYAVAFPGKKNYLLRRVSRILNNKNKTFGFGEKIFFIGSILVLSVLITTASVMQVREHAISKLSKAISGKHVVKQETIIINYNDDAKAQKANIRHQPVNTSDGMSNGIASISRQDEHATTAIPATVAAIPHTILTEKEQAAADQVQALKDQEQAKKDEAQAKIDAMEAILDQQQALKDQAQALIDQASAGGDRQQAKKEQPAPKGENKDQTARNKEQARLNQIQEQKNREQAQRNEEQAQRNEKQAQLNQIQDNRNQEQAMRNKEQARLNRLQEKKNEEQAIRNNHTNEQE